MEFTYKNKALSCFLVFLCVNSGFSVLSVVQDVDLK